MTLAAAEWIEYQVFAEFVLEGGSAIISQKEEDPDVEGKCHDAHDKG